MMLKGTPKTEPPLKEDNRPCISDVIDYTWAGNTIPFFSLFFSEQINKYKKYKKWENSCNFSTNVHVHLLKMPNVKFWLTKKKLKEKRIGFNIYTATEE